MILYVIDFYDDDRIGGVHSFLPALLTRLSLPRRTAASHVEAGEVFHESEHRVVDKKSRLDLDSAGYNEVRGERHTWQGFCCGSVALVVVGSISAKGVGHLKEGGEGSYDKDWELSVSKKTKPSQSYFSRFKETWSTILIFCVSVLCHQNNLT